VHNGALVGPSLPPTDDESSTIVDEAPAFATAAPSNHAVAWLVGGISVTLLVLAAGAAVGYRQMSKRDASAVAAARSAEPATPASTGGPKAAEDRVPVAAGAAATIEIVDPQPAASATVTTPGKPALRTKPKALPNPYQ
jgi:hypothetical protein